MRIAALALAFVGALALPAGVPAQQVLLPADDQGRVPAWLVLGMFPNMEGCSPSLPALIDEANAAPYTGKCEAGRDWQEYHGTTTACPVPNPVGPCSVVGVDLNCFFSNNQRAWGAPDNVRGYAFVYVHSPDARAAQIRYSSDDGSFITLNGARVFNGQSECHCYGHEHIAPVNLAAGENRLLISIGEAGGHWGFNLRFTTAAGAPMTDLQFSLGQPTDQDGDGINDSCDACPNDADNDGDADGLCGDLDNCPAAPNADQTDSDGDGAGNPCDSCPNDADNDADDDGLCGDVDNCPAVANSNQNDADADGIGDVCDPDIDNDGVPNGADNCPFDANSDQADFDRDGVGNVCDFDDDADGVIDGSDACLLTAPGDVVDATGCSIAQYCPCELQANPWKNHGAYVSCVAHTASSFRDQGLITGDQHGDVVSAAARSACGHRP